MKNIRFFILYLVINLYPNTIYSQGDFSKIYNEFDKVGNCNYKCKIQAYHRSIDKDSIYTYSTYLYVTNPTILHNERFVTSKDSIINFLLLNLESEKYDFVSNLFLYEITYRRVLKNSNLTDCEKWKRYNKNDDIAYWKAYFKR